MYFLRFLENNIELINLLVGKFVCNFIPNTFFIQENYIEKIDSQTFMLSIKEKIVDPKFFELVSFVILSPKEESSFLSGNDCIFNGFHSLEEFENFILKSNEKFNWAFFFTDSFYFKEMIFVTEYKFVDRLIEKNIADIKLEVNIRKNSIKIPNNLLPTDTEYDDLFKKYTTANILMSNYSINGHLDNYLSGIISEKIYAPFDRLMRCCKLSLDDIYLVSDMVPYGSSVNRESIKLSLNRFNLLTLRNYIEEKELFLMEFSDLNQLKETCSSLSCSQADTMLIIPKNTNINSFKSLLLKAHEIGADPFTGDEWMYLSEIKDTMEWFYGIERVYLHDECSIFISSNSEYIATFDRLNIDDDYKLIGCF
jgi:hypothetical protein